MRRLISVFGVWALATLVTAPAQAAPSDYGIQFFDAGLSSVQAGAHPDFTTSFAIKAAPGGEPFATTQRIDFDIPPGLIGNPNAFPECSMGQLTSFEKQDKSPPCPIDSQVGITEVHLFSDPGGPQSFNEPIYNMEPPAGTDIVARLGFIAKVFPTVVNVRLDPESDYGLTASIEGVGSLIPLLSAETTLWGVPTASEHDPERITPYEALNCGSSPCTAPNEEPRQSGLLPVPFMTNSTSCGAPQTVRMSATSYAEPDQPRIASATLPQISGCESLGFDPRISLAPTTTAAESPSGMDVALSLSQAGLRHPNVLATAHLKKAVVELPKGLTLNPAAANGLGACTEAQIGLVSEAPIRFDAADPACPDAAKVGTAQIDTPLLPLPLAGSLYLADPADNPFHTLLSGYLVVQDQGVTLKLAGRFDADPATGQITATFDSNPQQPFEELKLHFKSGDRGVLITPPACGSYAISSSLSPWSAADPANPSVGDTASATSIFAIDRGPGGSGCPAGEFNPKLVAGTLNPLAGSYSPFFLSLSRGDGTQRLGGLNLTLPPGLTGKLAGVPYCPEAAIAAAAAQGGLGQGAGQLASPSCPAASQLGSVSAGAGAGPTPFFVNTGKAYLAGPYKGAPLSLAIITPALAGPFDLGNVVVRSALHVDPTSARISAVSDPLPSLLQGIPLALREVQVSLDRPGFTLNPTNCEPMTFAGTATSQAGTSAPLSERFQVGSCASLPFKPRLSLRLSGGTERGQNPALRATLFARPGDANLAKAVVALPHSEFLDQSHIRTVCTRVQFAAGACPAASVYGRARAITPLLDAPLEGPVYLRSSSNPLPDLVADLGGQIRIVLAGRIDSARGGIRSSFRLIPDAPVSRFVLRMQGGKKGLLINSRDLCAKPARASVSFEAQNGKTHEPRPLLRSSCAKKGRKSQHQTHRR